MSTASSADKTLLSNRHMQLNLDIIQAVLCASNTRDPASLAQHNDIDINIQRALFINEGFAKGNGVAYDPPNDEPFAWKYSITALTESGRKLLELSLEEDIWESAKQAYTSSDCSWSLAQLYSFMLTQSRRDNII